MLANRTTTTLTAMAGFCIIFNLYLSNLLLESIGWAYNRCIYISDLILILLFCRWDRKYLTTEPYHEDANNLCELTSIINLLLIALTLTPLGEHTMALLIAYNGLVIALTLVVMKEGIRYGIFKD